MKVINYLNGKKYNPKFQKKDKIELDWTNWEINYSKKHGVDAFRDEEGYLILRKKHEYKGVNHYHYFKAENIKLGSVCEHCNEKSTKQIPCCNRKKTNDFFVFHRCEEYGCCYEKRICPHRYIVWCLYWSITSRCYITDKEEFKIDD